MLEELPQDLESSVSFRIAVGEASRLAEMARFDHGCRRAFAAGIGGEAEAIEREVMRRLSPGIHIDLVKVAVQDASEGRKARW
jgi:hypothetical protein